MNLGISRNAGGAVFLMVLLSAPASGQEARRPEGAAVLFVDAVEREDVGALGDPTVVRSRPVLIDFNLFARLIGERGTTLEFSLYDDVLLALVVEQVKRTSPETYLARGRIGGSEHGSFTIVVEHGVMAGNIRTPDGHYQIRYLDEGVHVVREIDDAQYPPCGGGLDPEPAPGVNEAPGDEGRALSDDGAVLDVLVVYTEEARDAAGGTPAMNAEILLAVEEANGAYGNSLIGPRLRLVHTKEIAYTESGFSAMLADLKNGNGALNEAHTLREAYCADMVSLFVEDTGSCGLAYVMSEPFLPPYNFAPWAFSVVNWSCAAGNLSFPHELGHNMGCKHDRGNSCSSSSCSTRCCPSDTAKEQALGAYEYSYGHRIDGEWRTIMAYSSGCASGCPKIPHFSNPAVMYDGDATGVAGGHPFGADNARSIDDTKTVVANWRESCVTTGACCNSNGDCTEHVENTCVENGGIYQGDGTDCSPSPCTCPSADLPGADPTGIAKNRYISFRPGNAGRSTAIRVTLVTDGAFDAFGGTQLWAGSAALFPEEDTSNSTRTFVSSQLECEPHFADWGPIDLLHVRGGEVFPSSLYHVQMIDESCSPLLSEASFSDPLSIGTGKWGDIVSLFDGDDPLAPQPDFKDIASVVAKFQGNPDAPIKARAQLQPNVTIPERSVDFKDIAAAVAAFVGTAYADIVGITGPCACPSNVTCEATACTNDLQCPDGYCISDFCTDACGRCTPP